MSLSVNLRHLEEHPLCLNGELSLEELDLDVRDEMLHPTSPLQYKLEVQKLEGGLLVQGALSLELNCQCVRCLKPFRSRLELPNWTRHLPLQGEEAAIVSNDCVDLTPYIREDILLEFPQHPVCQPECGGLPSRSVGQGKTAGPKAGASAWDELNKLKFNN
jgi:uncharacterized protein